MVGSPLLEDCLRDLGQNSKMQLRGLTFVGVFRGLESETGGELRSSGIDIRGTVSQATDMVASTDRQTGKAVSLDVT